MNIFRTISNLATAFAQDVNQFVSGLNGSSDVGDITVFPTITSLPGSLTATAGATGTLSGAYSYIVTFATGLVDGSNQLYVKGETTPGTASTTVNVTSQQINLANIPIGGTGVIARKIYRTKAGGSTYYFAFQIADNTTTSWTDTISDTSLGAQAPTTNTTGSRFVGNGSGLTDLPIIPPANATTTVPGLVEVAASPTSGAPVVSSRVATASDVQITGTTAQTIASFTPAAQGNFEVRLYFRVVTGTTNVTATITYADATGAQTLTLLNAQACAVGSYTTVPAFINAVSGTAITVQITSSVANQVYASSNIQGV